jgi:hypothetical protein
VCVCACVAHDEDRVDALPFPPAQYKERTTVVVSTAGSTMQAGSLGQNTEMLKVFRVQVLDMCGLYVDK